MPKSLLIVLALFVSACQSEPGSVVTTETEAGTLAADTGTAPVTAKDGSSQTVVDANRDATSARLDAGRDSAPSTKSDGGLPNATDGSRPAADSGATRPNSADSGKASADASGDARVTQVDAGSRKPVFKKTSCIDPSTIAADSEVNSPCEGVDLWISLPKQCITRACGLIFNIHGGGMADRTWMENATNMVALGKANDYVVVHPHKGTWSVSTDKAVVFTFMQQAIEAFDVDRKRIHATGYSQGGQISWALACEHADVIASVAPAEEINRVSDCWKSATLPAREIPVLFAYGKQDSIGGGYAAAQQAVDDFVKSHSMTGPQTITGSENSAYFRQRWTSASGNVIEFISHNYTSGFLAGHCLPLKGGTTFVNCAEPVDYNWGEEAVTFFKAHPMP
jgi:hypothetical protein